jgi:hypothetical protein
MRSTIRNPKSYSCDQHKTNYQRLRHYHVRLGSPKEQRTSEYFATAARKNTATFVSNHMALVNVTMQPAVFRTPRPFPPVGRTVRECRLTNFR